MMEFSYYLDALENSFVDLQDKIGLNIPAYWMGNKAMLESI